MKSKLVVNRIIGSLLLLLPGLASAAVTLQTVLQDHFNQQYLKKDKVNIKILTPPEQRPACSKIQIRPAPSQQHWERLTLPIICDQKNIIYA